MEINHDVHHSAHNSDIKNKQKVSSRKSILWWILILVVLVGVYVLITQTWTTPKAVAPIVSTVATSSEAVKSTPVKKHNVLSDTVRSTGAKTITPVKNSVTYAGFGTLASLFIPNKTLVCDVQSENTYLKHTGTVYVSGKKLYGDFTSYINGVQTNILMVDDSINLYAWNKGNTNGITIPVTLLSAGGNFLSYGAIDLTAKISYRCSPWVANGSIFNVPTNITFKSPGS